MAQRELEVTILPASSAGWIYISSISISGDQLKQTVKTPVAKYRGDNPYWNFKTKFIIDESAAQQNIVFNLKCECLFRDEDLGEVCFPIHELLQSPDAIDGKKHIVNYHVRKPNGKFKGSIKFAYQFEKKVEKAEEQNTMVYPTTHDIGSSSTNSPSAPPEEGYPIPSHSDGGYLPASKPSGGGYYPPPPYSGGGYPPSPKHSEEGYSEGGSYTPPRHLEGEYPPPRKHLEGGYPPTTKYFEEGYPPRPPHSEGGYYMPPPHLEGRYPPPPRYSEGGYYLPPRHSEEGYRPPPSHYRSAPPPHGGNPHTHQYAEYYEYSHPPPYGGYPYPPLPPPPGYGYPPPQEGYATAPAKQKPPKKDSKDERASGAGLLGGAVGGLLLRDMISDGGYGDFGFEF